MLLTNHVIIFKLNIFFFFVVEINNKILRNFTKKKYFNFFSILFHANINNRAFNIKPPVYIHTHTRTHGDPCVYSDAARKIFLGDFK